MLRVHTCGECRESEGALVELVEIGVFLTVFKKLARSQNGRKSLKTSVDPRIHHRNLSFFCFSRPICQKVSKLSLFPGISSLQLIFVHFAAFTLGK